jgi:hypothetical protein
MQLKFRFSNFNCSSTTSTISTKFSWICQKPTGSPESEFSMPVATFKHWPNHATATNLADQVSLFKPGTDFLGRGFSAITTGLWHVDPVLHVSDNCIVQSTAEDSRPFFWCYFPTGVGGQARPAPTGSLLRIGRVGVQSTPTPGHGTIDLLIQ